MARRWKVEISHLPLKDFPLHAYVAWDKLPFLYMKEREMQAASEGSKGRKYFLSKCVQFCVESESGTKIDSFVLHDDRYFFANEMCMIAYDM